MASGKFPATWAITSGTGRMGAHMSMTGAGTSAPALLALGAREVLAGLRVDPDHVALADEVGHLDHQPGLGGGGLEGIGHRRAPETRRGLDDLQVDRLRQSHAHRL